MQHVAVHPSPDSITTDDVTTLPELLRCRCHRSPEREAYRQWESGVWRSYSWREVEGLVARWQLALAGEHLASGDRVAVLLKNSVEWVCFDLAAQSLGLTVVPLYTADHEGNATYILADSETRLLLVGHIDQWIALAGHRARFPKLSHVLCLEMPLAPVPDTGIQVSSIRHWLPCDARPQLNLAKLLVLNAGAWRAMAQRWLLPAEDPAALTDVRLQHHIERICRQSLVRFPDYAQVRRFWLTLEPWTIVNDLVTPTFKLKRPAIEKRFAKHILDLYTGHMPPT